MGLTTAASLSKSCVALAAILTSFLQPSPCEASFWGQPQDRTEFNGMVYAYGMPSFDEARYREAVTWIFGAFEMRTGKRLVPGEKRSVGIKIFTSSGEGLETPKALVRAVIAELTSRGFRKNELFILDAGEQFMRETGYLPPLSERTGKDEFDGVPVRVLDRGTMWDKTWFYDNPLPVDYTSDVGRKMMDNPDAVKDEELRKSYLAAPLVRDVDFWINLPVIVDNPAMEISGSLANATLWNVSNRSRFLGSPANAPVAMAEIAAIPELLGNWALTILSMERFQFVGGPIFNSNYVRSDPVLLAGSDPAVLDAWAGRRLNAYRKLTGFDLINSPPFAVSFARLVGVGASNSDAILWVTPTGTTLDPVLSNPDRVTERAVRVLSPPLFWPVR
ncbi:MAG: DUF362 domain-containing protein [Opitutales bacterium]|jgi:hypothetical protein